jgi:hypothetical protein
MDVKHLPSPQWKPVQLPKGNLFKKINSKKTAARAAHLLSKLQKLKREKTLIGHQIKVMKSMFLKPFIFITQILL